MKTEKKSNYKHDALQDLLGRKQSALLKLYAAMANERYDLIPNLSEEINEINKQIIKR